MDESVQGWDIELKKLQTLHNWQKTGHFLNWFQNIFWNYSYAKWYILIWITVLYLLFSLLNFFIYPSLLRVYFNPKLGINLFTSSSESVESLIRTLQKDASLRLRYVLHYTGVIFFGLKLEHSDMSFKKLRWVIILYLQFVIGLLLLGFALNFVLSK
jgi:hypothetical protein